MTDTIIALSSGALPSGIAIVRASGAASGALAERFCGALPAPRAAALRVFRDDEALEIDRGYVLWLPGPASFTGEDCVEFHLHGSRAVVDRVLDLATEMSGVRLAEAGEFARRAFSNGKLDLVEAEALGDLISAETEAQRRFAVELAGGAQSSLYEDWRARLLHARSMIEAEIDFADEDDVPGSVSDRVWADMRTMSDALSRHMDGERRGRIMRSGLQVAIVGAPNAGKSTLLNAMAGSDRAIVSPEPGTTRDVVEARLDLGGHLVVLADTAGLRDEAGTVEGEGIRRAIQRAAEADLVLHVSETGLFEMPQLPDGLAVWTVRTKVDLTVDGARPVQAADYALSAVTGEGLGALVAALTDFARDRAGGSDLAPGRARHMQHLAACKAHLIDSLSEQLPLELRAEHLRLAGEQLGRITGRIDVEDMLGTIFSQFCIGK